MRAETKLASAVVLAPWLRREIVTTADAAAWLPAREVSASLQGKEPQRGGLISLN